MIGDGGRQQRIETPSHAATPWSSASRLDAAERMALLQAEIESLRVAMEAPYASSNDGRGTMGGGRGRLGTFIRRRRRAGYRRTRGGA